MDDCSVSFFIFVFISRQLRNIEKVFGGNVRVCDRTALILDIFNQRAATHEAALQVSPILDFNYYIYTLDDGATRYWQLKVLKETISNWLRGIVSLLENSQGLPFCK